MPVFNGEAQRAVRLLLTTLVIINIGNMTANSNIIGTLTEGVDFLDEMVSFIESTGESIVSYGFS